MSRPLKIGYVPLIDASALLVARDQGLFARHGLAVELVREVSWATVRDKLAVGALDAAHLLAPMAVAAVLGVSGPKVDLVAPLRLNSGGAAVTVSTRVLEAGVANLAARRREIGASPLTFALVFPNSIHSYLLRTWLSDQGLDPDADVQLTVAPPGRMAELLAGGAIEGFCAGAPWNAAACETGSGRIAVTADQVWPDALDKVLALGPGAGDATIAGLSAALQEAAAWAGQAGNRDRLIDMVSLELGARRPIIRASLEEVRLLASPPTGADARWLATQMGRWDHAADKAELLAAVGQVLGASPLEN